MPNITTNHAITYTNTYICTHRDNSRSIEDVDFLALTVLSLMSSLDSYTVRGKQNLAEISVKRF